jgi:cyclopropane fatty-acyl-phospholipid synthase-like methyltransferase
MLSLIVSILLLVFCIIVLLYLYQGPAYVPTLKTTVEQMVSLSDIKPGMKVVDLGSGDGRVVIAMAKAGALATGFEINPLLVWYSRYKIRNLGFSDKIKIQSSSFWNQDLGEYDVVTIFGINHVMERLGQKLARELKPGALVISNAFKIPGLKEVTRAGSLLVYKK